MMHRYSARMRYSQNHAKYPVYSVLVAERRQPPYYALWYFWTSYKYLKHSRSSDQDTRDQASFFVRWRIIQNLRNPNDSDFHDIHKLAPNRCYQLCCSVSRDHNRQKVLTVGR